MAENAAEKWSHPLLPEEEELSALDEAGWEFRNGPYRYRGPVQGQVCFELPWEDGILRVNADVQSDSIDAPSRKFIPERVLAAAIDEMVRRRSGAWPCIEQEPVEDPTDDDMTESPPVEEPAHDQAIATVPDDVSQWASGRLATEILRPDVESDMPRLREMILVAEDTGFTVDQSRQIAPWFLSFAEQRRDSNDPQDEAAVWSAIRTGASMLTPDAADGLRPLLQPGHSIETSLVALKMVGRLFEAQPPTEVDQHAALVGEIRQIAESLLNRYAITVSQSAAMAHLAIYALAAMGSSETQQMTELAQGLGAAWFSRRMQRKLRQLRDVWANRTAAVPNRPLALLGQAIEMLGGS